MDLTSKYGLSHGIHVPEGVNNLRRSDFVEKVALSASLNNFIAVRGFSSSETFDPQLIIVGIIYDETLNHSYSTPRVQDFLWQNISQKSILVGEGSDQRPTHETKHIYEGDLFYPFIGEYEIRFVDDAVLIEVIENLKSKGINRKEALLDQRRRNFLTPGIIEADDDLEKRLQVDHYRDHGDNRAFIVMHCSHFVYDYHILSTLEKQHRDYLLFTQDTLFLKDGERPDMSFEELQDAYRDQIRYIAQVDLTLEQACEKACRYHAQIRKV